jgi:inner membrane protein involved in colicin E2 resistance
VNRRTIRYGIAGCIAALAAAIIYAVVRLYVLWQRMDSSILLVNVIGFAAIAGVLIYLTKKEKDLEEEELFRD